jgi:hypothetical protein
VAQGSLLRVASLQRPDGALLERHGSFGLYIGCLEKLFSRLLKNSASRRDPVLHGFCKCSHIMNMLRFPKRRAPWLTA